MDNETYYQEIQTVVDEIVETVSHQSLQPKGDGPRRDTSDKKKIRWSKDSGAVYIVSVAKRDVKEHRAGVVAIAPYWLAAKGIVDGLHAVASDDAIRGFLKEQAEKKFAIERGFAQRQGVAQFTTPPVNDGGSK